MFEQICSKADIDIIQVDCAQRFSFYIQKTWVKLAMQRGMQFEISYGPSFEQGPVARKQFLCNVLSLIKLTKGKNIILSSEAN